MIKYILFSLRQNFQLCDVITLAVCKISACCRLTEVTFQVNCAQLCNVLYSIQYTVLYIQVQFTVLRIERCHSCSSFPGAKIGSINENLPFYNADTYSLVISYDLKGQSNAIFDLPFFSSFDHWVKIFSILVKISLSFFYVQVKLI